MKKTQPQPLVLGPPDAEPLENYDVHGLRAEVERLTRERESATVALNEVKLAYANVKKERDEVRAWGIANTNAAHAEAQRFQGLNDSARAALGLCVEALKKLRHRTQDGVPCWCFLWPDEVPHCEAATVNEQCRDAKEALAAAEGVLRG